jgi:hypothetical protein
MSNTFSSFNDTPSQIKTEGDTICLTFESGIPEISQGTVSWTLPAAVQGCNSDSKSAYCGMVVLLHTQPVDSTNIPVNGTFYQADNTADVNLHSGDKIGDALVVGAFYEGDKKSRGEQLTTSLIINELQPNTNYFIAGYAVDCQGRYHADGVRAYSDEFSNPTNSNKPSYQIVQVGSNGILPTDGTGLVPGMIYEFEMELDPTFPRGTSKRTFKFSADGIDISTYDSLINEINNQLAVVDNPPVSPVPLNQGRYYWDGDNNQLFQWDGYNHILQDVIVDDNDPSLLVNGTYWFNDDTEELNVWQLTGSPAVGSWNSLNVISYNDDPSSLSGGNDFWFNGTDQGYMYCGNLWCEQNTYVTNQDPSIVQTPDNCGHFWFDETEGMLREWNVQACQWEERYAIMWDVAPNNLPAGSYWFDDADEKLYIRSGSPLVWEEIERFDPLATYGSPTPQTFTISDTQPTMIIPNLHWYNPTDETLKIWDGSQFVDQDVLVWPEDPTDTESCDLWWDSTTDNLYKWDSLNSQWEQVPSFVKSPIDPFTPPAFDIHDIWFNPDDDVMKYWDGVQWIETDYILNPTDPTAINVNDAWYNSETQQIHLWNGASWDLISPIVSDIDPSVIPSGTFWFDTTNNALFQRNASVWENVAYSSQPLNPPRNQLWFDSTNNQLKKWDGEKWVDETPLATAFINEYGNIEFVTSYTGSDACTIILVPEGSSSGTPDNLVALGTAGNDTFDSIHDYLHYDIYKDVAVPKTTVTPDQFIFDFLMQGSHINAQVYGTDGIDPIPSYEQLGVGDDGTPDQKRELMNSIMVQLGYPTVEVELTKEQLNTAVDRALEVLRSHSSVAYKRGFFFLNVKARQQHYILSDKTVGFHKVVTVMSAYRFTSAFLSTAHGAGVYGQVVLQHLYNMGTFDLLSFHLVSQYVEQLEHLFATRLTYNFDEYSRELSIYNSFAHGERVLLDVMVERTEQEIIQNRWSKNWLENYALAEAKMMLSQIRGKYASLPGAGGGVSLNAADLANEAAMLKEQCMAELDDYVAEMPENVGLNSTLIIG